MLFFVGSLLAALLQATPQPTPLPTPSSSASPTASPTPSVTATPSPAPSASGAPLPLSAQPATEDHLYPGNVVNITVANATGNVTATLDNPAIATAAVDQVRRIVTLSAAQTLGRATLRIADASGASLQIPVRVGLDAGRLTSPAIDLRITGNPIDPSWLQNLIQKSITRNVTLQQGVGSPQVALTTPLVALTPGLTAALNATVQIAGTDTYYPVNATVGVNLQNVPSTPFEPPLLFYDDDPERIADAGVLFRATVSPNAPVRLYYYHENRQQPFGLKVVLDAPQPATVQLIDASAGPNIDVMTVGHRVTHDFLLHKPANQGVVIDLPAGAPYVADDFSLNALDGAAGSVGIRILQGGPVNVTVLSVAPNTPDTQLPQLIGQPQLPGDGHHRTGVFNIASYPDRAVLAYTVGGDDASLDYGLQTPPLAQAGGGHDYGEYGVWRTIDFTVTNPNVSATTVYLYERPMGGVVRSSFLVNGALTEVACARAPARYQIGNALSVAPGRSQIELQTMTDGGSNYPLEVGVTATPPSPSPPPITAPDGCFPSTGR